MWRERRPEEYSKSQQADHNFVRDPSETVHSFSGRFDLDVPQRLQRVWVLLWRLPKDEVPFAMIDD